MLYDSDTMSADELRKAAADMLELVMSRAPELVPEEVTDSGETYDALRCPVCGTLANYDSLAAVDQAERWTHGELDAEERELSLGGDDRGEFGDTLYYLHNDDHAVSLPEGWAEHWAW